MPVTKAKWGKGTTLARNGNLVSHITKIGGVSVIQEKYDATNHDSPDDYREKIGGLLDAGTLPIEGDLDPTDTLGQLGLKTDAEAHTLRAFVLTLPPAFATAWTFTALVTKFETDPPMDGVVKFRAELDISGKPVLGITASNNITALTITTTAAFPTFAQATKSYVADSAATSSVTFTATFAAGVCVLKENGVITQTLTSTVASAAVVSGTTPKTVTLEVTETGKTTNVYTFLLVKTS